MGFKHPVFLSGSSVYSCAECKVHLSTVEQILSRVRFASLCLSAQVNGS